MFEMQQRIFTTLNKTLLLLILAVVGCTTSQEQSSILVSVVADGHERSWQYPEPITVEQFLREIEFEYNAGTDRINPQPWSQIFDGIKITVVRVTQDERCENVDIPFETQTRWTEELNPGEEQQAQRGRNGIEEVCYRITSEDGVAREPVEIGRTTITAPQPEIIFVGPPDQLEPVPVNGTLVYLSNNNAWVIRGNSTSKRVLTTTSDLDPRVFSLSPDGRQLLIARKTEGESTFGNQLWLIVDTTIENSDLVSLTPQDVLYAEWVPQVEDTIAYSTGESRLAAPGWSAFNDLWIMRIDPETGNQINIDEILPQSNGGLYGWWGTQYKWSRDGTQIAWVHADKIGLVDLERRELSQPLLTYAPVDPFGNWSWRSNVTWAPNGQVLLATVHGPPIGEEDPQHSPVYNLVAVALDGSFQAEVKERTGMWAGPQYSPEVVDIETPFPRGFMAYLQAREWENSRSGDYDLMIADRDGSNARVVFPDSGQPGIKAQAGELAWSPDGRQLAFIYLGNLWVIDAETEIAHQLTQDGQASKPVWTR